MQCTRWQVFAARDDVIAAACEWVVGIAAQASRERGIFRVVLSGGNTPQPLYRELAQRALDWDCWNVYFADERCLHPGHPDSSAALASANLLSQVPIPPSQVFPIVCGEDGPSGAARAYSTRLAGVPEFDLVLLGLGEDGHTASLFPAGEWGTTPTAPAALPVSDAPPPYRARVSLSAWRLNLARHVVFLVCGATKRSAVTKWRNGARIPASAIAPDAGVIVMIDRDAFGPSR